MLFCKNLFKILFLSFFFLTSCSSSKKTDEESQKIATAEQIYNEAFTAFRKRNFEKAIIKFEDIERTYPYSRWAIKAQLMSGYASYESRDYESATIALDRFIKLHPGRDEIDYAYYLKSLSYYEQIVDIERDQGNSIKAKKALKEVIARFPNSEYAKDAQIKIDLVNNNLAGKEVNVGKYYLKKGNYTAAINRFKVVVSDYETTTHIKEALHRLVETYIAIGVFDEAKKYASVLGYNYPDSKWYKYSYNLLKKYNK